MDAYENLNKAIQTLLEEDKVLEAGTGVSDSVHDLVDAYNALHLVDPEHFTLIDLPSRDDDDDDDDDFDWENPPADWVDPVAGVNKNPARQRRLDQEAIDSINRLRANRANRPSLEDRQRRVAAWHQNAVEKDDPSVFDASILLPEHLGGQPVDEVDWRKPMEGWDWNPNKDVWTPKQHPGEERD